jgi:hypothetical protein
MGEQTRGVVVRELAEELERCRSDRSRRALFNTAEWIGLSPMEILELEADRRMSRPASNPGEALEESPVAGGDLLQKSEDVT